MQINKDNIILDNGTVIENDKYFAVLYDEYWLIYRKIDYSNTDFIDYYFPVNCEGRINSEWYDIDTFIQQLKDNTKPVKLYNLYTTND